ncbi:MAG TPA: hypothetical protein VFM02_00690 [Candidatus Paceibacterota bacterium]|nr:hypothetical protein [Candidatus Paceibacterota bacterium]
MIYRGRCNEIIFEFSLPSTPKGNIVLCEGLPGVPKQKEIISNLNKRGYSVFYPRYRGTWESGGEFLTKSPAEDIGLLIELLKTGSVQDLYAEKNFSVNGPIYIVGSSFGGSVALSLVGRSGIAKVVAFSPIVDFPLHNFNHTEQDLLWLKTFIRRAFHMAYRFSDENWDKMVKGELFNPKQKSTQPKNTLIVYDISDHEVDSVKIEEYSRKNNIQTIVTESIGHLSFSKIPQEAWDKVCEFLEDFKHSTTT